MTLGDLEEWMKKYPGLEIVVTDGAGATGFPITILRTDEHVAFVVPDMIVDVTEQMTEALK